ncbi:MAG: NAD-dependent epimerase/dehydratase family protein [candidate division WOR-3 bacterium]|nr:NAD-dependent epimerase/dehydratase family protein [candidate division WOR-3 bacterium]
MKPLNEMTVLVTGGAGFVGSNLVDALVARKVKTIVLDDLFTGKIENLPKSDLVEFVEGSVCDEALVKKLVKEVDLIFHLAARNIIVSTKNPREDFAVNIGGTLNILLAAKEKGIKVVYTSSTSIYGNPRYLPINEDDAINPFTPYATSKLAGENYCFSFYETYGLPTAVVRYSNIYGVKQRPDNPYCGVVAKFFDAVIKDQPPSIHGDGEQTRDFTYVDDAVEATILAASEKADGQIYNVGTGIETSINTLAQKIIKLFGKNITPTYIDRRDIDNIRRRVVNIEKIRKELRWIPKFSLDDGLKKTKEWILSKKSG